MGLLNSPLHFLDVCLGLLGSLGLSLGLEILDLGSLILGILALRSGKPRSRDTRPREFDLGIMA
jgi:hypothetical protein